MKKIIVAVIAAILILAVIAGIGVGGYFLVKKIRDKKTTGTGIKYEISYLEKEYVRGSDLVFKVVAKDKSELSAVKFTIDNGEEQATTTKTTKGDDDVYTIDTGAEVFSLSSVAAGEHIITFYVYAGETRTKLGSAWVFTITE